MESRPLRWIQINLPHNPHSDSLALTNPEPGPRWPLEKRPVAELVDSAKGKEGRFATPRGWSYLLAPLRLTREGGSSCHGSARNGRGASSGRGRPSRRAYR